MATRAELLEAHAAASTRVSELRSLIKLRQDQQNAPSGGGAYAEPAQLAAAASTRAVIPGILLALKNELLAADGEVRAAGRALEEQNRQIGMVRSQIQAVVVGGPVEMAASSYSSAKP